MDRLARMLSQAAGGVTPTYIEDVFSTWLYTGNGSTQTITNGIDLAGKGGLLWIKGRYAGSNLDPPYNTSDHYVVHSVSGATPNTPVLCTNQTSGNNSSYWGGFQSGGGSFNSNGFSLNSTTPTNSSNQPYVSWTFRKQAKFFDVVTYTGNGSNRTISHSLGSVPGCIIVKSTSQADNWKVYHRGLNNGTTPEQWYILLDSTAAQTNAIPIWNDTAPTSTQFTIGSSGNINTNGQTYVAYLFAHNAGGFGASGTDNAISCGSFYTDGSTTTIDLGWEPQWILCKYTNQGNSSASWRIVDNMRGWTAGVGGPVSYLSADVAAAESAVTAAPYFNLTSTGFTVDQWGLGTYIYIAIRRGPMRTPTTGTSVFAPVTRTGTTSNASITAPGFPVDFALTRMSGSAVNWSIQDKLRGTNNRLITNATIAEQKNVTDSLIGWLNNGVNVGPDATWVTINGSASTFINYFFGRAPGFFDVVCYTGTGANRTVSHNLGVAPELMIVKYRNDGLNSDTAYPWTVYHSALGAGSYLRLNGTNASTADNGQWNGAPTSSLVNLGTNGYTNLNTYTYVAYLFATVAGVSKVGSYTGNGSSQTINCGFTTGARFVLIKRTDSTGDWYVWDTARGIVAANDPHLSLNSTAAEVTTNDSIDPDNTGFIVNQVAATNINVTSATYIFLAIA